MPPNDRLFDPGTLAIPAYLSTGPDDPGLAAWKLDHPDHLQAGTWTPAPPSAEDERRQRRLNAARTVGLARDRPSLDPGTISLADLKTVVAAAKQDGPHDLEEPDAGPSRGGRE